MSAVLSHTSLVPAPKQEEHDEEAALLAGLLEHDAELSARQRARLVASIMQHDGLPAVQAPAEPSAAQALLRPGMVQAEALACNYALILALNIPAVLQDTGVPPQTVLLGTNYMVLSTLMMALSVLCCVQAFVRRDLRLYCRAVSTAMAATGIFGLLECAAFTAPGGLLPLARPLFFVTLPLISFLIGAVSVARSLQLEA
jgi:hypothetical protein